MPYLSDSIEAEDLSKLEPGKFNVIAAPRGAGKTTFMFDPRIVHLARSRKHIIYLIHNNTSKEAIIANHTEEATYLEEEWFARRRGLNFWGDIEIDGKLVVMCYQTLAALIRRWGPQFLGDIDLIVWDEFDDIRGYYKQEIKKVQKLLPNLTPEHIASIVEQGNDKSVIAFIYNIKKLILDPARIVLLAISATPEVAANLFKEYLNFIVRGKIEEVYAAQETVVIESVSAALENGTLTPGNGRKFWCYTQRISDELHIEEMAKKAGFKTMSLWSPSNTYWKDHYTPDKAALNDYIAQHHCLPPDSDCDFLIVNGVVGRSVDWYDTSFQDWICNSTEYEELGQFIRARFAPKRQYLLKSAYGLVEAVRNGPDPEFFNWHTAQEMKEIMQKHALVDDDGKPFETWNAAKKWYKKQGFLDEKASHKHGKFCKLSKKILKK